MNGIEILRNVRAEYLSTPVLLLTARSEVEDKINGLDCGADDYLTKPFVTGELLARVRTLTRRKGDIFDENKMTFNSLVLNKNSCSMSFNGNDVKLSLKEYQIMELLIANPRRILPKERIIEKIWGFESDVEYNNIEVYISFLRKKLNAIGADTQIKLPAVSDIHLNRHRRSTNVQKGTVKILYLYIHNSYCHNNCCACINKSYNERCCSAAVKGCAEADCHER